ncbi:GDSL-type esterase/lipase family protein [Dyadobacter psychrotolerans]|uniref:GDSL-type esterase/lipase family protein n=1 Tax=Dyadobacter psychrotolerans TaxID=2541721 RepID=UPI001E3E5A75|nr:GDSL-type esterase/lipase family protein [Dyadobacter psychrotolerans]
MVIDLHPEICFVMGGINDITVGVSPEKIEANYKAILETLDKNKITPVVTSTLYEQNDTVSQKQVTRLNGFLAYYCQVNKIEFIDLNKFLADSTGLKAEYAVDKTHLNEKAYKIWAKEIAEVLERKKL